jgi:hypothetical protein
MAKYHVFVVSPFSALTKLLLKNKLIITVKNKNYAIFLFRYTPDW